MNVIKDLTLLAGLLADSSETVMRRWRAQIRELPSARHLDVPTLNDHIPGLLVELEAALLAGRDDSIPEMLRNSSSTSHGLQRVQDAFDIGEVVAEYNILRGCIHDLADESGIQLQGRPFHIVNRVFDHAIGLALQTYATQRALDVRQRREEYLAFVAHDLRTPLNAIALVGRVLEKTVADGDASGKTAQMLKALRRNVDQLEKLVGKVLEENTNLQTEVGVRLERREFDLWPFVEALVHDLHPVAGTGSTQLINRVPEDLVVYADADFLKRIFQNLISNAIRYTPRGEISIEASTGEDGTVECIVVDTGAGIAADMIGKVFEKGETDALDTGGMGLGLTIVKTFAEAHGGTVAAESEEGRGAIFRFTLPSRDAAARAAASTAV
ncbi:sensor histidine kinase [Hydrocarboniphaga sp.]|uniref:sensor histidine kinase n=1 Tax=Hydrocarboniphaga sp. TaxID=2033016 RepID=UPI003D0F7794